MDTTPTSPPDESLRIKLRPYEDKDRRDGNRRWRREVSATKDPAGLRRRALQLRRARYSSVWRVSVQVESLTQIMESLNRNYVELVEDDFRPIDGTVARKQMSFPLVHQSEIPDDQEKSEWNKTERGGSGIGP